MTSFDFRITALGQDMLLRPLTQAGRNWASDNLPKAERRLGRNAMIPARRIRPTLTAILLVGLTIAPLEN
jgi:hypothetical protein